MFSLKGTGTYPKTKAFLDRMLKGGNLIALDDYGQLGVAALSEATPKLTGRTAASWGYRITKGGIWTGIEWFNTNADEPGGPSVAVLIQYGHATRSGSYILGEDYINPAMDSVFNFVVDDYWKRVRA